MPESDPKISVLANTYEDLPEDKKEVVISYVKEMTLEILATKKYIDKKQHDLVTENITSSVLNEIPFQDFKRTNFHFWLSRNISTQITNLKSAPYTPFVAKDQHDEVEPLGKKKYKGDIEIKTATAEAKILAKSFYDAGKYEEAVIAYSIILRLHPSDPVSHTRVKELAEYLPKRVEAKRGTLMHNNNCLRLIYNAKKLN